MSVAGWARVPGCVRRPHHRSHRTPIAQRRRDQGHVSIVGVRRYEGPGRHRPAVRGRPVSGVRGAGL